MTFIFILIKKNVIILSNRDKKILNFLIHIYLNYADDLGIQSKNEHEKLVVELNEIKKKWEKQ